MKRIKQHRLIQIWFRIFSFMFDGVDKDVLCICFSKSYDMNWSHLNWVQKKMSNLVKLVQ